MKAGYYKDSMHNYLVLLSGEKKESEDYRYRMITHNRIQGLLPVSIRYIDGKRYLYYEITSRQSLDTMLTRQNLTRKELESMMTGLVEAKEHLSDYLLDPAGLLLTPEYIFYDLREKTYLYTYYPDSEEKALENIGEKALFKELADHVEKSDRETVRFLYRLCALAENPEFSLRREDLYDDVSYEKAASARAENAEESLISKRNRPGVRSTLPEKDEFSEREDDKNPEKESFSGGGKNIPERGIGRSGNSISFIPFIFWGAAAFLLVLRCVVNMNHKGGRMCMAAVIIGALLGTLIFYAEKREAASAGENEADGAERSEDGQISEGFERGFERNPSARSASEGRRSPISAISAAESGISSADSGDLENSEENWSFIRSERLHPGFDRREVIGAHTGTGKDRPEKLRDAETVYLAPSPDPCYQLSGIGRWSGINIELDSLPCVVGKLEKYVDFVVDDRSVSRIHAEISEDNEGQLLVRDLNSTNGTWIGNRRLEPNESALIPENEIIRFGRAEFKLRET